MIEIQRLQNRIICGDCLEKLQYLPNESVDFIYLDPPFGSGKDYEIIWGNGAELKAYGDRWEGGINHYIGWMRERLEQCHRVLKSTGSIYLHADKHAVHYLKVMMDEIFDRKNFRNEIIWSYRTGGASKRHWSRKHDNILFYTKSNKWTFNLIKEKVYYEKKFFKGDYHHDEKGMFVYVHPRDVWEIKAVLNVSKERIGYPTQKPEALLEKIIRASSNEGDIVLDPFAGGGTTLAVAKKLKRKFIGIDVSPIACTTAYKRLYGEALRVKDTFRKIIDYPIREVDLDSLTGLQFQQWVTIQLNAIPSKRQTSDGGIDGTFMDGTPFEVKKGALSRPHVQKLHSAIVTARKKKGVLIGKSIPRTVYEKIAELKKIDKINIIVLTTQEIIDKDFSKLSSAGIRMQEKKLYDFFLEENDSEEEKK